MENKNKLMMVIILAMIIFIGLAFAQSIVNSKAQQTDLLSLANETTNLTVSCYVDGEVNESDANCNLSAAQWYDTGDWRESESQCYLSSVTVANSIGVALTEDTDYELFESTGIVRMLNTTDTNSTNLGENVLVGYSYCGEGYLTSSGDRGLANLWVTMVILMILAAAIIVAYKLINDK